jgi:WD40 repeat protein
LGSVLSVAFSFDGSHMVSGSSDETVRLWNVATDEEEHTFRGHSDWVRSVAFSPNGSRILSGSDDRTIRMWDVATGGVQHVFSGHSDWVYSVAFSPDGSRMVSGSGEKTVRLWNIATGQIERTFSGHSSSVSSVAFSPDGSRLVSGSDDNTVRIWNVASGEQERSPDGLEVEPARFHIDCSMASVPSLGESVTLDTRSWRIVGCDSRGRFESIESDGTTNHVWIWEDYQQAIRSHTSGPSIQEVCDLWISQ